jgi:hypothetical protein
MRATASTAAGLVTGAVAGTVAGAVADRVGMSLLAEAWGPVASFAAQLGLPAGGPLMLPGNWVIS